MDVDDTTDDDEDGDDKTVEKRSRPFGKIDALHAVAIGGHENRCSDDDGGELASSPIDHVAILFTSRENVTRCPLRWSLLCSTVKSLGSFLESMTDGENK